MRLVGASIQDHGRSGLQVDPITVGTPTLIVGPNGAGKSRLLEALDVLLGPSYPERRLSTSLESPARRRAAEDAARDLEVSFCFELDQIDSPGSWDSQFLGAHLFSQYELLPLARERALSSLLSYAEGDPPGSLEMFGEELSEPVRSDYLRLLVEVVRALRYVEVGVGFYESWKPGEHAHWPALRMSDLPREAMHLASRLAPLRTTQEEMSRGTERFPFLQFLLDAVARNRLSNEPFNPGIPECADLSLCEFPNIDLIRVGPESPDIPSLLRQLAATVLDLEGILRSDAVGGEHAPLVRAFGDKSGEHARLLRSKLGEWDERLTRRLMENVPPFVPSDPLLRIRLGLEPLARSEFALSASLDPDPQVAFGAGHLKWVAYALAKTTADVRRSKTATLGGEVALGETPVATKASRPLILLLDEPESHLHWQLQQGVANWMAAESLRPNRTLIAATHSPVFLGISSLGKTIVPMNSGRAVPDPRHLESLVYLAGADRTALHWLVRGYILVEGSHEMQILKACFGDILREQDLHLQQLFGSYAARAVARNLAELGRPIVAILDRVSRAALEGKKKGALTHEEKTALDLLKHKSARVVHFEVHDVIQSLPEPLLDAVLDRLFPDRERRPWTWGEVVARHEAERARKNGFEGEADFKFAFLRHVGLFDPSPGKETKEGNLRTIGRIVSAAADALKTQPPPPQLKGVFLRALQALDSWPDPRDPASRTR